MVWGSVSLSLLSLQLVVIAGNLNAVRYRKDILLPHVVPLLQAHLDMTHQHDNATSLLFLCLISCKTGMSVFCHGQRSARISLPLSTSGPSWIAGCGLGPFPSEIFRELASALVEEWGNISQQELADVVQYMRRRCTAVLNAAGGHTRYWLLLLIFDPPFVQGHIIPFLLVTCLWNLFSLCLSCWILVRSYKYLHMLSLLKINAVDCERTFLFFAEFIYVFWQLLLYNIPKENNVLFTPYIFPDTQKYSLHPDRKMVQFTHLSRKHCWSSLLHLYLRTH